jgi:hypothetical protein
MLPSSRPQLLFYPPIAGERGYHALWGSRCYDYAHRETLRLLLSNIQWWLTEYNIDGFRWDGVSSMVFKNHAIGRLFKCVRLGYRRAMRCKIENYIILAAYMSISRPGSSLVQAFAALCVMSPGFCKRASLSPAARFWLSLLSRGPDFYTRARMLTLLGFFCRGTYDDYFSDNTDLDAQLYIMLANELAATLHPDVILIAGGRSITRCRSVSKNQRCFPHMCCLLVATSCGLFGCCMDLFFLF